MASLITCRICEHRNERQSDGKWPRVCSSCKGSLAGIVPAEISDTVDPGPAEAPQPPPAEHHIPTPGESTGTSPEGPADSVELVLEFPFGSVAIRGETLLGRENTSFGHKILEDANGGFVSGRHAIVSPRDGRFYVRHIGRGQSNFTFLDDRKVEEEEALRDGQRLSLSNRFHITVRIR